MIDNKNWKDITNEVEVIFNHDEYYEFEQIDNPDNFCQIVVIGKNIIVQLFIGCQCVYINSFLSKEQAYKTINTIINNEDYYDN